MLITNTHSDPLISFPSTKFYKAFIKQGVNTAPLNILPYIIISIYRRMLRIKDPRTSGTPYFNKINIITFLN